MLPEPASRHRFADRCVHQLRLFFIALQFFTRLPIPRWVGFAPDWLQHASRYFPAVGIVVGAVTAGVYACSLYFWPQSIAVLLSTAAGIYLTGALHEDGFADTCDGFGGGFTPDRVLEIMKDSRIGAYGAIGIGLLIAVKCAVLISMPAWSVAAALMLAHPLSRLASAALIWRLSYVKAAGKAKPLAQHMSTMEFCIAAATVLLPLLVLRFAGWLSWPGIAVGAIAAAMAALWLARFFIRRIGGYTGDCLGAVQQVSEVAFYLGLLAVLTS
ncbi:MAG: adenosylcobinamide-GDP ribazoletransferase [Burkholderiales bacterium RIFCSPLOWO2_02_FULL_57_36]|nr:MAG: adenosylcobinamide-GDP ribazoletransferase [Burkholderiales bacterium RIFCSPLOWO2_02_FULL_57_36]